MKDFFRVNEHSQDPVANLQKCYNKVDNMHDKRFGQSEDDNLYEKELANVDAELNKYKEGNDSISADVRRLAYLTKGNIYLRKGQWMDEMFRNPQQDYEEAEKLLGQVWEQEGTSVIDCLIRLNMGKYFRNVGKNGRRSYYISAWDEFRMIVDMYKEKAKSHALSRQETHILLDAMVNMGRAKKNLYELDEAMARLGELVCLLLLKEENCQITREEFLAGTGLSVLDITSEGWEKIFGDAADMEGLAKPYLVQAVLQLGIVLRKMQEYDKAEFCFYLVKRIDEKNIDAANNLSVCLRKKGNFVKAKKLIADSVKNKNRFAIMNKLKCDFEELKKDGKKEGEKIVKLGEEIAAIKKNNDGDREVRLLEGMYKQYIGAWDEALEIFCQLCEQSPYIGKGSMGLKAGFNAAKCLMEKKEYFQAAEKLEKILAECSDDVLSKLELGKCMMALGNYEKARIQFEKILQEELSWKTGSRLRIRTICYLGECFFFIGRISDARKEMLQVKECGKNFKDILAEAQYYLTRCDMADAEMATDADNAAQIYQRVIASLDTEAPLYIERYVYDSDCVNCRVKLLEKTGWNMKKYGEYTDFILKKLVYLPGSYTLGACANMARFVEHSDLKDKNILYKALSRIELDEKEEVYDAFSHFTQEWLFRQLEITLRGKILSCLFELYEQVLIIKNLCRYTSDENGGEVSIPAHYTRIPVLKKLLVQQGDRNADDASEKPRLRLWNSAYMNDSFEGERFIEIMEAIEGKTAGGNILSRYFLHMQNSFSELQPVNSGVYITSFSRLEDNIQMWVAYGDNANGCRITFQEDFFDIRSKRRNPLDHMGERRDQYPLYSVQYVGTDEFMRSSGAECTDEKLKDMRRGMEKIWDSLHRLEDILAEEDSIWKENSKLVGYEKAQWRNSVLFVRRFVADRLNEIRFLFKDAEYKHEEEVRMVRYSHNPEMDEDNFEIPRLFINVDKDIKIKEVLIGPGVSPAKVGEIVSWLGAVKQVETVSKSRRHYTQPS